MIIYFIAATQVKRHQLYETVIVLLVTQSHDLSNQISLIIEFNNTRHTQARLVPALLNLTLK